MDGYLAIQKEERQLAVSELIRRLLTSLKCFSQSPASTTYASPWMMSLESHFKPQSLPRQTYFGFKATALP